MIAGRGRF